MAFWCRYPCCTKGAGMNLLREPFSRLCEYSRVFLTMRKAGASTRPTIVYILNSTCEQSLPFQKPSLGKGVWGQSPTDARTKMRFFSARLLTKSIYCIILYLVWII